MLGRLTVNGVLNDTPVATRPYDPRSATLPTAMLKSGRKNAMAPPGTRTPRYRSTVPVDPGLLRFTETDSVSPAPNTDRFTLAPSVSAGTSAWRKLATVPAVWLRVRALSEAAAVPMGRPPDVRLGVEKNRIRGHAAPSSVHRAA